VAVAVAVVEDDLEETNRSPPRPLPPPVNPQYYVPTAPPPPPTTTSTTTTTTTPYTRTTIFHPVHPELSAILAHLPRRPTRLPQCPHCAAPNIRTQTRTAPHSLTWLSCLLVLIVFWPLCWLPLVLDMTKRTEHYCPSCHQLVGTVAPYQDCCVRQQQQ